LKETHEEGVELRNSIGGLSSGKDSLHVGSDHSEVPVKVREDDRERSVKEKRKERMGERKETERTSC